MQRPRSYGSILQAHLRWREDAPRVLADQARHLRLPNVLSLEARGVSVRWVGHSNPDTVSLDLLPTPRERETRLERSPCYYKQKYTLNFATRRAKHTGIGVEKLFLWSHSWWCTTL